MCVNVSLAIKGTQAAGIYSISVPCPPFIVKTLFITDMPVSKVALPTPRWFCSAQESAAQECSPFSSPLQARRNQPQAMQWVNVAMYKANLSCLWRKVKIYIQETNVIRFLFSNYGTYKILIKLKNVFCRCFSHILTTSWLRPINHAK